MSASLYNLYRHTEELIACKDYLQAQDNLELMKELLDVAVQKSINPECSTVVRVLQYYVKEIETKLQTAFAMMQ